METEKYNFNTDFQLEILSLLIKDRLFLATYRDVIKDSYFTLKQHQDLCTLIYSFISQYNDKPSCHTLIAYCERENRKDLLSFIPQLYQDREYSDQKFAKDRAVEFAENCIMREAVLSASESLSAWDKKTAQDTLRKALTDCSFQKESTKLFADASTRVFFRSEDLGDPVATLWKEVDDFLGGGVDRKTLNILLAPTNMGKSAALVNLGVAAIAQGRTVFHFTLEMSASRTLTRYDARLVHKTTTQLYKEGNVEGHETLAALTKYQKMFKGECYVQEYPPDTATISMIRGNLDSLKIEHKIYPDVVIIDYGDLLKHTSYKEYRHQVASSFIQLRKIAVEYNVVLWTATQANRAAFSKEIAGLENTAEDIEKVRIADTVLSLGQTKKDEEDNILRIKGIKLRNGRKNWIVRLRANFDTMFLGNDYTEETLQRIKHFEAYTGE